MLSYTDEGPNLQSNVEDL